DDQGYVTPAQARAFIGMSHQLRLTSDTIPPTNPVARAYLDSLDPVRATHFSPRRWPASERPPPSADPDEAAAVVVDVLLESGIIAQPRALLTRTQGQSGDHNGALQPIRMHMQFVFDGAHAAYVRRSEELTYLANTNMAGCALQGRSFTA